MKKCSRSPTCNASNRKPQTRGRGSRNTFARGGPPRRTRSRLHSLLLLLNLFRRRPHVGTYNGVQVGWHMS